MCLGKAKYKDIFKEVLAKAKRVLRAWWHKVPKTSVKRPLFFLGQKKLIWHKIPSGRL